MQCCVQSDSFSKEHELCCGSGLPASIGPALTKVLTNQSAQGMLMKLFVLCGRRSGSDPCSCVCSYVRFLYSCATLCS
jgi:hypothetical protein